MAKNKLLKNFLTTKNKNYNLYLTLIIRVAQVAYPPIYQGYTGWLNI